MIKGLTILGALASVSAASLTIGPGAAAAQQANPALDAAARFGAREGIQHMSLSPDGKRIAFIVPLKGKGNALFTTVADGSEAPKRIIVASGDPDNLRSCGWASNDRLVCTIFFIQQLYGYPAVTSRIVAVDAAGGNMKLLSRRQGEDATQVSYYGGDIIDWLPGTNGTVLMARSYVPEQRLGTLMESRLQGLGVDRVDSRTGDIKRVETPRRDAVEYISDGRGKVRIMGIRDVNDVGYVGENIRYFYRLVGSDAWQPMSQLNTLNSAGFNPYAVDPSLNAVYGFRKTNGRKALFKLALDGSLKETPVYAHPEVDADDLVRFGRSRRVVGVTYATEKRQNVYFDPEMEKLRTSLGKALGEKRTDFVESNEDESKLLVWAGSDIDPGRFYLLDRATKKMGQLMDTRPDLEGMKLAQVKPVKYRASDGTMVPGYLTLPVGSTGRNLPAIVMPHGGPAARDEWGFDWLSQFYANRGYAVLQPNFRGSAGYGDTWLQKNGFQSWKTAIGDVTDAGRWLVSEGIADPSKLAIVGWSYGGYAALQSNVVAPDLFKAVVAIAPVTDFSQFLTDNMKFAMGKLVREYVGSGPHIREGSPAQNARAIKAPVMLFHGTMDGNVFVNQSRMMNDRLKDAGKKSQLVIYEGLDHQLDDSEARADMLRKSDQFLRASMGM